MRANDYSRRAMGVASAVVAVVVFVQLGGVAHATVTRHLTSRPGSDEIAFVSNRDGNNEIYALEPESSALRRLTRTPADETGPAWSPDRSKLAFFVSTEGLPADQFSDASEIWTMHADGSDARLLRSGLGGTPARIAWAPDGKRLAFAFHRPGGSESFPVDCGEVWVMHSDGSDARRLLASQPIVTGLDWSPDGKRIAYSLDEHMSCQGGQGLWTMNPDGSGQRSLGAPFGRAPSWSPDGTTIAFDDWRNTCHACGEVWLMNADGSDQRPLVAEQSSSSWAPSWSPDGSMVVFERAGAGTSELWAVNADGSGEFRVTDNGWDPDW